MSTFLAGLIFVNSASRLYTQVDIDIYRTSLEKLRRKTLQLIMSTISEEEKSIIAWTPLVNATKLFSSSTVVGQKS
jgi:hypothetical protein